MHCFSTVLRTVQTLHNTQFVSNPLQLVQDLGALYSRSGKFKKLFSDSGVSTDSPDLPLKEKPHKSAVSYNFYNMAVQSFCSISSLLDQYAVVLASLESCSSEVTDETATKARGLLNQFQQGTTAFGFKVAVLIFSRLEQLNKSLQSPSATVSGMIAAAESLVQEMRRLYDQIFSLTPSSMK